MNESSLSTSLYSLIVPKVKLDAHVSRGHPIYRTSRSSMYCSRDILFAVICPFMAWGERLSRIRRRPKLAWNPQNAGRTLSCKDARRFSIKRRLRLTLKREISSINAPTRFRDWRPPTVPEMELTVVVMHRLREIPPLLLINGLPF